MFNLPVNAPLSSLCMFFTVFKMIGREQSRLHHDTPSFGFSKVRKTIMHKIQNMCKIKSRFHWKIFYHHLCKYQRKRDILSCINYHYFKCWEVLSWHRVDKLSYIFHYMQILWDSSTLSTHWPLCLHFTPEVTKLLSSFLHFLLSCLFCLSCKK